MQTPALASSTNPLAADLDHVLVQAADAWALLRGARLFITGGTGFFGCWLLETLLWANDRLELGAHAHVLTRDAEAFRRKAPHLANHAAITLVEGDVKGFAFPDEKFSHVIHAATEASVKLNAEAPFEMFDTVVEGTRRTLELARHCGARRFLLTSSGAVYGRQPSEITHVDEEFLGAPDVLNPRSAYGEGKRVAEFLCALYAHSYGLETTVARAFAFAGPGLPLDGAFALGNFIRDGLAGNSIAIAGDGTPRRSYLYASDLAIWLWTILVRGASNRAYNVGNDRDLSIRDLACAVAAQFEPAPRVEIAQLPIDGARVERYVPSVERAAKELGLRPTVGLEDAIAKTIAHARLGAAAKC